MKKNYELSLLPLFSRAFFRWFWEVIILTLYLFVTLLHQMTWIMLYLS